MQIVDSRWLIQLSTTLLSNSYLATLVTRNINTTAQKGICVPFLNCYSCPGALFSCPVGTVQHFAAIGAFPIYPLAFLILVGITAGRMSCGWLCPFGFLQELLHKIQSPKHRIPDVLHYGKYLALIILVVLLPVVTSETWFCKLCPAGSLTAAIPWALWNPVNPGTGQPVLPHGPGIMFWIGLSILTLFLCWSILSKRPFCRVACPLGAFLSFFNSTSIVRLEVDPACDGCDLCEKVCPMETNVSKAPNSSECIRCLECTACDYVKLSVTWSSRKEIPDEIN